MINATRELRGNLRELKIYNLRLSLCIDFPHRDFFDISCSDQLICVISKNSVFCKISERKLEWETKEFYKKTKLSKEQVAKIERIAEEWMKKYSNLMI